jgi:YL1 nuclear protein C-terminal domain
MNFFHAAEYISVVQDFRDNHFDSQVCSVHAAASVTVRARTRATGSMASASARRAWNDAMKATAGAALPPALQGQNQKRRSDRHKKQDRRSKARKVLSHNSGYENDEFRTAVWVDALEGIDPSAVAPDDDDDYDELEELGQDDKKKRKRGSGGGGGGGSNAASASAASRKEKRQKKAGVMPKRFLPRSLGSILMEEANRGEDGVALAFIGAEAKVGISADRTLSSSTGTLEDQSTWQSQRPLPRRKFCPVTGLFGQYTEPKSGIPYASLRALEQIRERAPPWMTLSGTASYYEAVKSIREE